MRGLPAGQTRCYTMTMTVKTAARRTRRATQVPMTTMEDIPVLGEAERAALRAALKKAERQIKSGDYVKYDSKTFRGRLLAAYREAKR